MMRHRKQSGIPPPERESDTNSVEGSHTVVQPKPRNPTYGGIPSGTMTKDKMA